MRMNRIIHAAPLALLLLCGASHCAPSSNVQPGSHAAVQGATSYGAVLSNVDRRIGALQKRADKRPNDWLIRQHLAGALLERAGLTSNPEDHARVQTVLDQAFAIHPGVGPHLLAARFNYSIHRLDTADEYLRKVDGYKIPKREWVLGARLLRAQIALQRGQYPEALAGLEQVTKVNPKLGQTEFALYHSKTGNIAEAERLFGEALATADEGDDARQKAWIRLQLGIIAMEQGRYDEALTRLQAADAQLSGWWLVREHIAEVYALTGRYTEAAVIYEDVVQQAELPQYLDALAGCYERMNRPNEARVLIERAAAGWSRQLAELPESAMGHGLEHFLEHGTAEQALELAKKNHDVRPGGEAQVLLAKAQLKAGRPAEALEILQRTLASPYRSADLHDVAREANAALDRSEAAEEQRAKCLALNPHFYDEHDAADDLPGRIMETARLLAGR